MEEKLLKTFFVFVSFFLVGAGRKQFSGWRICVHETFFESFPFYFVKYVYSQIKEYTNTNKQGNQTKKG